MRRPPSSPPGSSSTARVSGATVGTRSRPASARPRPGTGGRTRPDVPLLTKRIYEPATADEGRRILVMRLWPRGIKKTRVDAWYRDLAPELPLMRGFRAGEIPWEEYRKRYRAGRGRPEAQTQLTQLR